MGHGAGLLDLPSEVIHDVLARLPRSATRDCVRTCRQLRRALTRTLYADPRISCSADYVLFAETLLVARPDLGPAVRRLDLSRVVGTAVTVRLGEVLRSCLGLREFHCPQAALTTHTIQVFSLLGRLRVLDLAGCIERFEMGRVLEACAGLRELHTFRYPRCALSTRYPVRAYPPNLKHLALRGGLRDDHVDRMARHDGHHDGGGDGGDGYPRLRCRSLLVSHAPSITAPPMLRLIASLGGTREESLGDCLQHLTVAWPCMRFGDTSLDALLLVLGPGCKFLSLAIDYIGPRFFENAHAGIETLAFTYSGVGKRRMLGVEDLLEVVSSLDRDGHEYEDDDEHEHEYDEGGGGLGRRFPALRRLGLSHKLALSLFGNNDDDDDAGWQELRETLARHAVKLYSFDDNQDDNDDSSSSSSSSALFI